MEQEKEKHNITLCGFCFESKLFYGDLLLNVEGMVKQKRKWEDNNLEDLCDIC